MDRSPDLRSAARAGAAAPTGRERRTRGNGADLARRLALGLWCWIACVVALLGTPAQTSAARSVQPPASIVAPSHGDAIAPAQSVRDDRESSSAIAVASATEFENETEDDDASHANDPAPAFPRTLGELVDPRTTAVIHTRWLSVSTGLGRGPPLRRS